MSTPVKVVVLFFVAAVSSGQLRADDYADGVAAFDNKDFAAAVNFFSKAIEHDQNNADAFVARGGAYDSLGELDKALADCDAAIRLDPNHVSALANRGSVWFAKNEFDKALADYEMAIRLDPNDVLAYINRGAAWHFKEEFDKAIADYDMAIRLDPNNSDAYVVRGDAWQDKGELDKALADYDKAIRLDPKDSDAYVSRGEAWQDKGEYDKALADYDAAIRLDPKSVDAHNNRAWLRATCPDAKFRDGAKAIEDATKGCELTDWKDPYCLGTLAAAYAEAGQFDKAEKWQKKAIELDPDDDEDFGSPLKLYQEGKPYREEPGKK